MKQRWMGMVMGALCLLGTGRAEAAIWTWDLVPWFATPSWQQPTTTDTRIPLAISLTNYDIEPLVEPLSFSLIPEHHGTMDPEARPFDEAFTYALTLPTPVVPGEHLVMGELMAKGPVEPGLYYGWVLVRGPLWSAPYLDRWDPTVNFDGRPLVFTVIEAGPEAVHTPEPLTGWLVGMGIVGLMVRKRVGKDGVR